MSVLRWLRIQWDRVGAVALAAGGALSLLLGWLGVSRSAYPAEALPYIVSGGLFGLLLIGLAAVLWLSADMRDEWRKLDSIEEAWREVLARTEASATSTADANGESATPKTRVRSRR